MGKMKELFMKMQEENYQGNPEEFLSANALELSTKILCPNCCQAHLKEKKEDLYCYKCGYEFVLVDENTIRFK